LKELVRGAMDLNKILGELYAERNRLSQIIETLEGLGGKPAGVSPKKRGRKYMDPVARKAVSQRMKRYWAARREQAQKGNGSGSKPAK
jgi:hypothetical protein